MSIGIDLRSNLSEKVRYDYADYPIYVRHALLSSYPNYSAPVHWHDDLEFVVVLSGEMSYNINGEILLLKAGEGVFVNSCQMHFGFSDKRKECDFICVILHPMLVCLSPHTEQTYVTPLLQNQNLPCLHLTPENPWVESILAGIRQIYLTRQSAASPLKIQSIFAWIWSLLYENMPAPDLANHPSDSGLSILKNMIGFIQHHYSEKVTLPQIAKAGGVGQSKCCRLFGSCLGQTPNAYLTVYRLNRSAELLCNTDLPVTEIAYATGFNGASYYTEAFGKCFGIPPTKYRKRLTAEKKCKFPIELSEQKFYNSKQIKGVK